MDPIDTMTAVAFLVVGLSHLLRPREWVELFEQLRARGAPGAFINAMMSLSMGALIVGFHGTNWSGGHALVSFIGWGMVNKGFWHMCFPRYSLRSMGRVTPEKSWQFAVAGGVLMSLAAVVVVSTVVRS
jgi:hypothetical protein